MLVRNDAEKLTIVAAEESCVDSLCDVFVDFIAFCGKSIKKQIGNDSITTENVKPTLNRLFADLIEQYEQEDRKSKMDYFRMLKEYVATKRVKK